MKREWAIGAVVAVGGIGATVSLLRSGVLDSPRGVPLSEMSAAHLGEHMQRVFGAFEFVELGECGEAGAVASELAAAKVYGSGSTEPAEPDARTAEDRDAILKLASEFLFHRFGPVSREDYKAWRRSLGYTLDPSDFVIRARGLPDEYAEVFGEPYPGDGRIEEVFDRYFEYTNTWNKGVSRLNGIAVEAEAMMLVFSSVSKQDPTTWPRLRGALGPDLWHGRSSGTAEDWWRSPHGEFKDYLGRAGTIRVATLGIIGRFGDVRDPKFLPLQLTFYEDETGRWWQARVFLQGDLMDRPSGPITY